MQRAGASRSETPLQPLPPRKRGEARSLQDQEGEAARGPAPREEGGQSVRPGAGKGRLQSRRKGTLGEGSEGESQNFTPLSNPREARRGSARRSNCTGGAKAAVPRPEEPHPALPRPFSLPSNGTMARTGCGPACSLPQPPPFRFLDLVFALVGTLAFLLDLVADVWVAATYLRAGHFQWGGLVLGLLLLSSLTTQFFSWAWFRSDSDKQGLSQPSARTSKLLHVLQLGYLYRCLCVLRVGFQACKMEDATATHQAFAIFLSHDVSLLRLFETFLESAPQLILVIYIILHTNQAEIFQVLGICTSFLCITWALLDYHQTLRSFLRDKHKLAFLSSILYFLWNFLLMCPRILSLALFAVVFSSYIFIHFLVIWLVMFLWVSFQGTDLMEHATFEWFYRATVAVILYFCWFNVAEGKTRHRSAIYHTFLFVDSGILIVSWWCYRFPSSWDSHMCCALLAALACYALGIFLKCVYYKCFHPAMKTALITDYDEVDSNEPGDGDAVVFRQMVIETPVINHRTYRLSQNFFAGSLADETRCQQNGTASDMYL